MKNPLVDMIKGQFIVAGIFGGIVLVALLVVKIKQAIQIDKATELVAATADLFDEDEDFQENRIIHKDPWDKHLRIVVKGETFKTCTVTSAGPDKIFDTEDDISKINANFHPSAKLAGESIGKTTGRFGIGLGKGLVEAVKEEFKKEP